MKVSTTGYKRNSKDKKHKQLYIPGDILTMLGVDDYVQATPQYPNGSLGQTTTMAPGTPRISFPGAMGVIEEKLPKAELGLDWEALENPGLAAKAKAMGHNTIAEYRNSNWGYGKNIQQIPSSVKEAKGLEADIDKWLDHPKGKAYANANLKDNTRHSLAGMYTQQAIKDKVDIPIIGDALGFVGANAMGLGHEISTLYKDGFKDWESLYNKTIESGEDTFNNFVGSAMGLMPGTQENKKNIISNLSSGNWLPDGVVRKDGTDLYNKKQGGQLPQAQTGLSKYQVEGTIKSKIGIGLGYQQPSTGLGLNINYNPYANSFRPKVASAQSPTIDVRKVAQPTAVAESTNRNITHAIPENWQEIKAEADAQAAYDALPEAMKRRDVLTADTRSDAEKFARRAWTAISYPMESITAANMGRDIPMGSMGMYNPYEGYDVGGPMNFLMGAIAGLPGFIVNAASRQGEQLVDDPLKYAYTMSPLGMLDPETQGQALSNTLDLSAVIPVARMAAGPLVKSAGKFIATKTPLTYLSKYNSFPAPMLFDEIMSTAAPKGNMYGQNQVLTQRARLLDPAVKRKFFANQAPETEVPTSIFQKSPKDLGNRITPENYEDFVNRIHGSTDYGLAVAPKTGANLGIGNYGKPGMVYQDAPLNNLGKDIINAHEKNHGIFAGTLSPEMETALLKPFGTRKPIPNYPAKHQADEVLGRMGQFKNAIATIAEYHQEVINIKSKTKFNFPNLLYFTETEITKVLNFVLKSQDELQNQPKQSNINVGNIPSQNTNHNTVNENINHNHNPISNQSLKK